MFAKLLRIRAGDDNKDQFMSVLATEGLIGKV